MPDWFVCVMLGLVGAVVGRVLNVCIARLPASTSTWWPRADVRWCHRAPQEGLSPASGAAVIVLTAVVFALAWVQYGPTALLLSRVTFACALMVLFLIDLRHHLLPNAVTLPGIIAGVFFSMFAEPGWSASVTGVLLGGAVPWLLAEAYYRSRHQEGMGMGDVKMLAMVGGFIGWKLMFVTLAVASMMGAATGGVLVMIGRGGMKSALPFGTFLAIGAAAAVVVGQGMLVSLGFD